MTPILTYLATGVLPTPKVEGRKIQHKARHYQLTNGILYRRSYLGPLLSCVDSANASFLIREIHEGICGIHAGPRMVVAKIMNAGYYWPGMHQDAEKSYANALTVNDMRPTHCVQKTTLYRSQPPGPSKNGVSTWSELSPWPQARYNT